VRWYVNGFEKRTKIRVDLEVGPNIDRLSKDVEIALFRIVQESLTNVYRHSGSSTAKVRLALESAEVTLQVSDEGNGFSAKTSDDRKQVPVALGVGISGMAERMHQLGGRLEVRPGAVGVVVKASVPLRSAAANPEIPGVPETRKFVVPPSEEAESW
jgi:signal transduction histidine kinase